LLHVARIAVASTREPHQQRRRSASKRSKFSRKASRCISASNGVGRGAAPLYRVNRISANALALADDTPFQTNSIASSQFADYSSREQKTLKATF